MRVLAYASQPRFGAVYNAPACDVHRRVRVRVAVTTDVTPEAVAGSTAQHSADGTRLGGVGGIHVLDQEPCMRGLVGQESLQLTEGPARHEAIEMRVPDARALPNAGELFQAERSALCVNRFGDDRSTQLVILVPYSSCLVPGQPAQDLLSAACSLALETGPDTHPLGLELLPGRTVVQRSARGRGRVAYPQVHAERWTGPAWRVGFLDHDVQEPAGALSDQHGGRGSVATQGVALVGTEDQRHVDPSPDHGQRGYFVVLTKGEDPGIVVHALGAEGTRQASTTLGPRHGGGDTTYRPHREIRGQAEVRPQLAVDQMVKFVIIRDTFLDRNSQGGVARIGERVDSLGERLRHRRGRRQLAANGPTSHGDYGITRTMSRQPGGTLPLPAEAGSFRVSFLWMRSSAQFTISPTRSVSCGSSLSVVSPASGQLLWEGEASMNTIGAWVALLGKYCGAL